MGWTIEADGTVGEVIRKIDEYRPNEIEGFTFERVKQLILAELRDAALRLTDQTVTVRASEGGALTLSIGVVQNNEPAAPTLAARTPPTPPEPPTPPVQITEQGGTTADPQEVGGSDAKAPTEGSAGASPHQE